MNASQNILKTIIKKMAVFKDLTEEEASKVLRAGSLKELAEGDALYKAGDPSEDLFIVLTGTLEVQTSSGEILGQINPGTCTGEMGALTHLPRSANVVARDPVRGLMIRRQVLSAMMRDDLRLQGKVLRNLVGLLSNRLTRANISIESYSKPGEQDESALEL